jgi:2-amino-1-hydroxyethylphosphonate dioxygenase (glycine-forming)
MICWRDQRGERELRMKTLVPEKEVDELLRLLCSLSSHRRQHGQGADLLVHSLKCAAAARRDGADDEMVAAALLHDIGHAFCPVDDEFGELPDRDAEHAFLGQRYLELRLPARVAWLVGGHVKAKRYLLRGTVGRVAQSVMSDTEAREFERDPDHLELCRLREWDWTCDGSVVEFGCPDDHRPLLLRLCASRR